MDLLPYDDLVGLLIHLSDRNLLIGGAEVSPLPGTLLYSGAVLLRYGFALLNKPSETVLPYLVLDDFQQEHTGFGALTFMLEKGFSYPRADVLGYRASDGAYREYFMKQLDLARPVRTFAYPGVNAVTPMLQLDSVIWLEPGIIDVRESIDGLSPFSGRVMPVRTMNPVRVSELPLIVERMF